MEQKFLDENGFREAVKSGASEVITTFRRSVPYETMYAFLLYTNGEGSYVIPSLNTEQGLLRGTERYTKDPLYSGSPDLIAAMNRWSPCDWVYHSWGDDYFGAAQQYLDDYCWTVTPTQYDYNNYEFNMEAEPQRVYQICLEALAQLDAEGLFGTGEARERLTIDLWMGDQSDEGRLEWAQLVNPPSICQRLQAEMEAGLEAFHTWSAYLREARQRRANA